ncbi:MAG TPA: LamG-like jellyroll fold domain-containing protein, partial [Pyrinomonadaceae bacterium]|nr:LamG-like jellyroll fold domain-containing protein [Pyrinomonadaceae bacterium]
YIDGQLNNQTSFSGQISYAPGSPLIIGGRELTSSTTTYPGTIDEPEFYSRALLQSEIQDIFSADIFGKCKPRCTEPPAGLVGWWTADDNPFDIWNDNHGIEEAKGNFDYSDGKVGRAFGLDGLSDVRIPASESLDVGVGSGFTIDAWINPTVLDNQPIVEWNNGGSVGVHFWVGFGFGGQQPLGGGSGALFADIVDTEGNSHIISSNSGLIKADVFQHVAVTYDTKNLTATLYINGVNVAETSFDTSFFTPQTSYDVYLGGRPGFFAEGRRRAGPAGFQAFFFNGSIDEVEIFDRALSQAEIQQLNNAGFAGKCKPCKLPPFSMVGWWNADANTRDDSGNGNNGTLQGGYQLGKVGQAFSFNANANDGLVVRTSASLSPTQAITLDAWVKPASYPNSQPTVISKEGDYFLAIGDGKFSGIAHCNIGDFAFPSGGSVPLDAWTHIACTYDQESAIARLYVNGEEVAAEPTSTPLPIPTSAADLSIGKRIGATNRNFEGLIDEVEVFDRVLSQAEIQSIVAAGVSGKCKFDFLETFSRVPSGDIPTTVTLGDATITYNNVVFQASTLYQTLDTYQAGPMPFGFSPPLEVVDISSNTAFNGTARVCFNLQAAEFSGPFLQLRILHVEGNELVNRTSFSQPATRALCADVTSLSPFVITQNLNAPTAAPARISGRVTLADGSPLSGAVIELTGSGSRATITDANGHYAFAGIATDAFYTATPQRANYSFSPASLSFSLLGDKTDAVFTAIPDAVSTLSPLDTDMFFVRQQYLDFLGREPDAGGLAYWTDQISRCGADAACAQARRIEISAAFFDSQEFQQTGSFIYRLYHGVLARSVSYNEFTADRGRVVVGPGLDASKLAYAAAFSERPEFIAKYGGNTTAESFVDALLQTVYMAGTDLAGERETFISLYNSANGLSESRAVVLRAIGDSVVFQRTSYNEAFVLMEYFGYLKRDPDIAGYNFWLDVLNNREQGNYRSMVCAFMTSAEYQQRFSPIVSRSNRDCGE